MLLAVPTLHPTMAAFAGLGAPEALIIVLVVLLLFGGRKLPEVARGTGRALRIFKAETKGLMDDDEPPAQPQARAGLPSAAAPTTAQPPVVPGSTAGTGATAASELGPDGYSKDNLPPTHTEM
jgi:sec-independent protein translocase protein TatA